MLNPGATVQPSSATSPEGSGNPTAAAAAATAASSSPSSNNTNTNNSPNTSSDRSSSRRRGAASAGASSSHILRTTSAAAAAAAASSSNANSGSGPPSPTRLTGRTNNASGGGSSSSVTVGANSSSSSSNSSSNSSSSASSAPPASTSTVVIAPPPRVALGSSNAANSASDGGIGIGVANSPDIGAVLASSASSIHSNGSGSHISLHNNNGGGGGGGGSSSNGGGGGGGGGGPGSGGGMTSGGSGSGPGNSGGASAKDHYHYATMHHQHTLQQHVQAKHHHRSASAQAQQLVKEKDLRIAQLERELAIMEAEFTRELDKLSKAESETATFWQAKHNRLQQQLAHADATQRLLRTEVELREAERAELRAGWEDMQQAAARRDEEAQQLRQQVRGLKEWVSASTRTDGQVASDEVFGDGMARLANSLQNWVIVHFRRAKMALATADKTACDELARLVPMCDDLCHTAKLHLLQSAVSRLLVESVFESYFAGLPPDKAAQLAQVEAYLHTFAGTAAPVNQWRALTLTIVNKDAAQQLQAETARVVDDVVARIDGLLDAVTDAQRTDTRDQALHTLVASAVDLSHQLVAQKAVFRVFMPDIVPHQQALFDSATMEDIGGEDDDGLDQREIACVTFPGIIKHGDETGSHLQYRNVICKARVLCAPE